MSRHVGSSWTGNQTCVSCIGRQILYQCATKEFVLMVSVLKKKKNKTVKVFGVPQESRVPKEECLSQLALTGEEG